MAARRYKQMTASQKNGDVSVAFPWRFRELGLDARHGIQHVTAGHL